MDTLEKSLRKTAARVTIEAPCGSGKTEVMIQFINTRRIGKWRRILIVFPSLDALHQFHERFENHPSLQQHKESTTIHSVIGLRSVAPAATTSTTMCERLKRAEEQVFGGGGSPDEAQQQQPRLVVLTLYTNMKNVQRAEIAWDGVIMDEVHHAYVLSRKDPSFHCTPLPVSRIPLFDWCLPEEEVVGEEAGETSAATPSASTKSTHPQGIIVGERIMLTATLPERARSSELCGDIINMARRTAVDAGLILGVSLALIPANDEKEMMENIWRSDTCPRACIFYCATKAIARNLCKRAKELIAEGGEESSKPTNAYVILEDVPSQLRVEAMEKASTSWLFTCRCLTDAFDCVGMTVAFTQVMRSRQLVEQILGRGQRCGVAVAQQQQQQQQNIAFLKVPPEVQGLEDLEQMLAIKARYQTFFDLVSEGNGISWA